MLVALLKAPGFLEPSPYGGIYDGCLDMPEQIAKMWNVTNATFNNKIPHDDVMYTLNGTIEYMIKHSEQFTDDVIDVPSILSDSVKEAIFGNFNQLSWMSGTGELGLNFYTEFTTNKYMVAFEDGIGLSTVYILLAMIDNYKQFKHVREKGIVDGMLESCYYADDSQLFPKLYLNAVESVHYKADGSIFFKGIYPPYLQTVKETLAAVNHEGIVEIVYLDERHFTDYSVWGELAKSFEFIDIDGEPSFVNWIFNTHSHSLFSYYGKNKMVSVHASGELFNVMDPSDFRCLVRPELEYSVIIYPVIEQNKRFQNGCLKTLFRKRDTFASCKKL